MTSTKLKGQKKETMCAHSLVSEGYWIVFKSCTVKRGPFFVGLDFADCIDVIGVRGYDWIFVSCTYAGHESDHRKAILEFKTKHYLTGMSFQLWVWHKPRWRGRGKAKHFEQAHWDKEEI
jgi:hypothetical protein